jgi:hypothetical protein
VVLEESNDLAKRGDVDRLVIEWRSLLRQIVGAEALPIPRWLELQAIVRKVLASFPERGLPEFPLLGAEQTKPVSHRLHW